VTSSAVPQLGQVVRAEAALGGAHEEVAQLLGEPRHEQGGAQLVRPVLSPFLEVTGQEFAHDDVLLGAREEARRRQFPGGGLEPQE